MRLVMLIMVLMSGLFLIQCSSSDKNEAEGTDNSNVYAIVDGKVNKSAIRQTFLNHRDKIRGCYKEAHTKNPEVSGKFVVNFKIQDDGSIKDEEINKTNSTIDDEDFGNCLLGEIRGLTFPKAPEGQDVTVRYPLNFSGRKKMGSSAASEEPMTEE